MTVPASIDRTGKGSREAAKHGSPRRKPWDHGQKEEKPRQGRYSDAEDSQQTQCRPAGALWNPHNIGPTAYAVGYDVPPFQGSNPQPEVSRTRK